jgi:hypothetical protein
MTTIDAGRQHKLYEWRGGERASRPAPQQIIEMDRTSAPVCNWCFGSVQKVVGGWWCDSCETAAM